MDVCVPDPGVAFTYYVTSARPHQAVLIGPNKLEAPQPETVLLATALNNVFYRYSPLVPEQQKKPLRPYKIRISALYFSYPLVYNTPSVIRLSHE